RLDMGMMILGLVLYLLAIGNVANVVLFGSFLVWAALSFRAARTRDRVARTLYPAGTASATVMTVVAGAIAWAGMAFWAHGLLIGIRPL
ncbi:MAG: NnrU family protein, partial [Polaromonas sp.]